MKTELPELPPLWSDPPPMGHNGGPELRPRRAPGRPTVDTLVTQDETQKTPLKPQHRPPSPSP